MWDLKDPQGAPIKYVDTAVVRWVSPQSVNMSVSKGCGGGKTEVGTLIKYLEIAIVPWVNPQSASMSVSNGCGGGETEGRTH